MLRSGLRLLPLLGVALGASACNLFSVPCDTDAECTVEESCREGFCVPIEVAGDGGSSLTDGGPPPGDAGLDGGGAGVDGGGADLDGGDVPVDGGADGGADMDAGPPCTNPLEDPPLNWWDACWHHRARIYLHAPNEDGDDLDDFPVLFRFASAELIQPPFDTSADPPTLESIRFVSTGRRVLPHELVRWDPAGTNHAFWVSVPSVTTGTMGSSFYVYWGNDDAQATQDPAGVWSNAYEAVLHFDDDGADGLLNSVDGVQAQAYDADAGPLQTMTSGALAGAYTGAGNSLGFVVDSLETNFPREKGTLEAWLYHDVVFGADEHLLGLHQSNTLNIWGFPGSDNLTIEVLHGDDVILERGGYVPAERWEPVRIEWDTAARWMRWTSNGYSSDASWTQTWSPIGQQGIIGWGWTGAIDELRVTSALRSNAWYAAEELMLRGGLLERGRIPFDAEPSGAGIGRVGGEAVLWTFDELVDDVYPDTGEAGWGLDLLPTDPSRIDAFSGGIELVRATTLATPVAPTQLSETCKTTGSFTFEAWLKPTAEHAWGPARVFTYSDPIEGLGKGSFLFGQDLNGYGETGWRVRLNGGAEDNWPYGYRISDSPRELTHVVVTRDADLLADNSVRVYINGQAEHVGQGWSADSIGFYSGHRILIGDEHGGTRPWLGGIYMMALSCWPLDASQILQNYNAGPL
jgi:hypothetical protein